MNLLNLLDNDEINFQIQYFLGNGILQPSTYCIKKFVFGIQEGQKYPEIDIYLSSSRMSLLRLLDLSFLETNLSQNYSFLRKLTHLITLDLTGTNINSLDNLYNLNKLKNLYLCDCKELYILDDTNLEILRNLVVLDLSGSNIIDLPSKISSLKKLEVLNLSNCYKLTYIPNSLGNLSFLRNLLILNCLKLRCLPSEIGNLSNLNYLNISYNYSLVSIPESIHKLTKLSRLQLVGYQVSLFDLNLSKHSYLTSLKLDGLRNLNLKLPEHGNLRTLELHNCNEGSTQSNYLTLILNRIPKLLTLRLDCQYLQGIPEVFHILTRLQILSLYDGLNIKILPKTIGDLRHLKTLEISKINILELDDQIGKLKNLYLLKLNYCTSLSKISSSLTNLKKLENVQINNCSSLRKLPANLITLPKLKSLECNFNDNLKLVPSDVSKCYQHLKVNLTNLNLTSIGLKSISWHPEDFTHLSSLQRLNLSQNYFEKLPESIELLSSLTHLIIQACPNLISLPKNILRLKKLETLELSGCLNLTEIPVSNLKDYQLINLKNLNLEYTFLKSIWLDHNYGQVLECLNLSNTDISYIPENLGDFTCLRELHLGGCRKISTLPGSIRNLQKLQYLNLNDCTRFKRLPLSITHLESLEKIDLQQTDCYIDYLPSDFKKKITFSLKSSNQEMDY